MQVCFIVKSVKVKTFHDHDDWRRSKSAKWNFFPVHIDSISTDFAVIRFFYRDPLLPTLTGKRRVYMNPITAHLLQFGWSYLFSFYINWLEMEKKNFIVRLVICEFIVVLLNITLSLSKLVQKPQCILSSAEKHANCVNWIKFASISEIALTHNSSYKNMTKQKVTFYTCMKY